MTQTGHGEAVAREPTKPRLRPVRLLVSGVALEEPGAAFIVAAVVGVLNAIVAPIVAALRLPLLRNPVLSRPARRCA